MSVTNLIDQPVAQFDENEPLGLSRYATALTDFIIDCETPITIGIQGDWGVGKTSLLNMVEDQLEDEERGDKTYPVIYFNTWQYAQLDQEDHLAVAMLHDIVERIEDLNSTPPSAKEKAGEMAQNVGSMAVSLANQVVKNKAGADVKGTVEEEFAKNGEVNPPPFLQVMKMMVDYKQQFRELVEAFMEDKKEGSRLVIMIDDLDRIRPARALDLLSSVKNFLDVPYCVFVLAVDYSVIQRGVEEKLGSDERKQHGKSYFDKIIQVPFEMPVSSYRVDRYTMSLLGWKWKGDRYKADYDNNNGDLFFTNHRKVSNETAIEIENLVESTVGQNPRSIKRSINYYSLLKRVFSENGGEDKAEERKIPADKKWRDLYLEVLFGFCCFKLAYPELFEYFIKDPTPEKLNKLQNIKNLDDLNVINKISQRVDDIEDEKTDISAFFGHIVEILDGSEDNKREVTTEEFQPVWDIITYTNLAGGTEDGIWGKIANMVEQFAKKKTNKRSEDVKEMKEALSVLEHSEWGNPLCLGAKDGGSSFFNLYWNGDVVGSVTSTQRDPLRFFVEPASTDSLSDNLSEEALGYVEKCGTRHHGYGSVRVHLRDLLSLNREQRVGILKEINQAVVE